ncbi:helix-turn-helix domain-containing protein [Streptomyces sp. NPDC002913]
MSDERADKLRRYRRAAGLSQEQPAHRAGMSAGPIRKIEQGHGGVRMETLHTLARVLMVKTSDLMAAGPPQPVEHDDPNSQNLRELRIALTPALALGPAAAPAGDEPDLRRLSGRPAPGLHDPRPDARPGAGDAPVRPEGPAHDP